VLSLLATPPDDRDPAMVDLVLDGVLNAVLATSSVPPASDMAALLVTLRAAVPGLASLTAAERDLLQEWLDRPSAAH
jgi:hypothetical protein